MKNNILKTVAVATCAFAFLNIGAAQESMRSGYFIDGYSYRHQMNPAFASSRSYLAIPGLGNVNASITSNMAINTFLYPYNGQLTTFMSGQVSPELFLGQLKKNNRLGFSTTLPIFSIGTWGRKGGFTTVEMNMRGNAGLNLPYDLFDFMKNIGARQTYNISNLGMSGSAYLEIAVGHAHKITDRLDIGAKVKLLVGAANANFNIDRMHISMSEEKWSVEAEGAGNIAVPGIDIPTKGESGTASDPSQNNAVDFSNIRFPFEDSENPGEMIKDIFSGLGYGAAIDLGAVYKFDSGLLEGLNLSAALLDFGFISWRSNQALRTSVSPWIFDGFDNVSLDPDSDNSIDNQFEDLTDGLEDLFKFEKAGKAGKARMLSCIINIGAEYEMPFYRRMSVGFLSSTRISGPHTYSEGRFSLNLEPSKWFGFSTSYGISTFGSTWGALINFSLPGLGLFIGTDNIPVSYGVNPTIPYKTGNFNVNFGLNFNLSKTRTLGYTRVRK